jgi:hypothetical protein
MFVTEVRCESINCVIVLNWFKMFLLVTYVDSIKQQQAVCFRKFQSSLIAQGIA